MSINTNTINRVEYILPTADDTPKIGSILLESVNALMEGKPCAYQQGLSNVDNFGFLTIKPIVKEFQEKEVVYFTRLSMTEIFAEDLFILLGNIITENYEGKSKVKLLKAINNRHGFDVTKSLNFHEPTTKNNPDLNVKVFDQIIVVFKELWEGEVTEKTRYMNQTYKRSIKMFNIVKENGEWVVYMNLFRELLYATSLDDIVTKNTPRLWCRNKVFIGSSYRELVRSEVIRAIQHTLKADS